MSLVKEAVDSYYDDDADKKSRRKGALIGGVLGGAAMGALTGSISSQYGVSGPRLAKHTLRDTIMGGMFGAGMGGMLGGLRSMDKARKDTGDLSSGGKSARRHLRYGALALTPLVATEVASEMYRRKQR